MMRFLYTIVFSLFLNCSVFAQRNVLFIVHTETINGKGVLSLYKAFKAKGHKVTIAFIPLLVTDNVVNNKILYDLDLSFAKKFDAQDVIFPCGQKAPYKECVFNPRQTFDCVFVQNPYNLSKKSLLDPTFTLEGLKKITKKLGYIVYGPHLFHQNTYNEDTYNERDLKKLVDVVFVDSESTQKIFMQQFGFLKENAQVSGYQNYKNVRDMTKPERPKNYDYTMLWMPRWTLHTRYRDLNEGGSTFLSYYPFFYNFMKANPNIRLIFRPHALLFKYGIDAKFFSQEDVDNMLTKFKSLPNIIVSEHTAAPLENDVVSADVVISDGTSALGEVVVANKPIIYLSNGWNNEFNSNDLAQEMKKFLYLAHDPLEIELHLSTLKNLNFVPYSLDDKIKDAAQWKIFQSHLDPVQDPASFIVDYVEKID